MMLHLRQSCVVDNADVFLQTPSGFQLSNDVVLLSLAMHPSFISSSDAIVLFFFNWYSISGRRPVLGEKKNQVTLFISSIPRSIMRAA